MTCFSLNVESVSKVIEEKIRADFYKHLADKITLEIEKWKEEKLKDIRLEANRLFVDLLANRATDSYELRIVRKER